MLGLLEPESRNCTPENKRISQKDVCFFQPPCSIRVSWARDQTRAAAATFAAMLAPLTHCAGAEDQTIEVVCC